MREYLDKVFIKNIDIWGFINCYYPFIELLSENYEVLDDKEKELLHKLNELYINNLYLTSDKVINLSKLFNELNKIKQLLHKISNIYNISQPNNIFNNTRKGLGLIGMQTNKTNTTNKTNKTNTTNKTNKTNIFTRKQKIKRFRNPFYLSSK